MSNQVLALSDSQSVKTTGVGGPSRGYDGVKKIKGRKRHLLVDTQGLVIRACVHSADITDREGLKLLLEPLKNLLARFQLLWADSGYQGQAWSDWVKDTLAVCRRKPYFGKITTTDGSISTTIV